MVAWRSVSDYLIQHYYPNLVSADANGALNSTNVVTAPIESNSEQGVNKLKIFKAHCPLFIMVVAFIISLVIISTITILVYKNNRPTSMSISYFNENCENSICDPIQGLTCIEYKCQCGSIRYYDKKCHDKSSYLQACPSNASYCLDNSNLICLDNLCICNVTSYWNGSQCLLRVLNGGLCDTDYECLTKTGLICDRKIKKCICPFSQ